MSVKLGEVHSVPVFAFNPQGGRPSSSSRDDCNGGGSGLGLFAEANLNAGPVQAGVNANAGRNYPTNGDSSLYLNGVRPSASIGDSWGIRAGAEITLYGGAN